MLEKYWNPSAKAMSEENKIGRAAFSMVLPTLFGLFGILAVGWYPYLLVSALTGLIAWEMLGQRSRKIFLRCIAVAAVAGIAEGLMFRLPDGSISDYGIVLVFFPALLFLGFFAMKIYSIETGDEDD